MARLSRESWPDIWFNIRAASLTLRLIGPLSENSAQPPSFDGTRPCVGLIPYTPQNAAGTLIEPPPSLPVARGQM